MEDGACMYNKYGYCKFRDSCKRSHFKESCGGSVGCKGARICHKRHTNVCKKNIIQIEDANLAVIVLTNIQESL